MFKTGEIMRMVSMAAILLLIVGVWMSFRRTAGVASPAGAPPAGVKPHTPAPADAKPGKEGPAGDEVISPGYTSDVRDHTVGWDAAYLDVLAKVVTSPEVVADERTRVLPDPWILWKEPAKFRVRSIRIEGTLQRRGERPIDPDAIVGMTKIHEGQLTDDRGALYSFIVAEEPVGIRRGDRVTFNGVFFKIWAFQNNQPDDMTTAAREDFTYTPLLIGHHLKKLAARPDPPAVTAPAVDAGTFAVAVVSLFVVIGGGLALFTIRERRNRRSFEQALAEKRRARRSRGPGGAIGYGFSAEEDS
jgi:hypothetical protein